MNYKIEHDVPLPSKKLYGNFPFAEMKVGDSFLVNGTDFPQTLLENSMTVPAKHDEAD
jgi:hypothetical protein